MIRVLVSELYFLVTTSDMIFPFFTSDKKSVVIIFISLLGLSLYISFISSQFFFFSQMVKNCFFDLDLLRSL